MAYKLTDNGFIDLDTGASVPFIKGNRHFDKMMKLLVQQQLASYDTDGNPVFTPDETTLISKDMPTLNELRESAFNAIDVEAGNTRARYITNVPGQAETYVLKAQQAQQFKDAGYPASTVAFPLLESEIDATGHTPTVAANNIISKRDDWMTLAKLVETERRKGKLQVESANDVQSIEAAKIYALATLRAI